MSARDLERKQARRLLDILNYARKAVQMAQGISTAELGRDEIRRLALERCFEVIGEAARHLIPETASQVGGLPLAQMCGMRNLITHDYHRVDPREILKTAQNDLAPLVAQLAALEVDLCRAAELELPPK
jgi:uncharacterized protein with HEPN domain